MKSLQLVLTMIIASVALLGSAFWVMAQSAPPDPVPTLAAASGANDDAGDEITVETSAIQAVGLLITPTIGTVAGTCAVTNTVQVRANTQIYYCFKVQNTGVAGDEQLTIFNVQTSLGLNRNVDAGALTLNPGEVKTFSDANFTDLAKVDATSFITWTARPADSDPQVTAFGRVNVDVVGPAVSFVATVGQDRAACASSQSLRIPSGQAVSFCVKLTNQGDITLTNHSLIANAPLNINATFNYTLPPGSTLNILPTNMTSLGINNGSLERGNITGPSSNSFSYIGRVRTDSDLTVTGASTTTVDVGTTTVRFTKTVSTIPEDCTKSSSIQVTSGTNVYYCVAIQNTGVFTLTEHHLTETYLSIDVTFNYPLRPGGILTVTNDFLARNNLPIVFGPFEVNPKFGSTNVVGNTMSYSGRSLEGFSVTATSGTSVTYPPTPTFTPTDRPRSTSTPIPGPTNTPTFTPIPQSPTPTLTPTYTPETPSPTPTRSYAISLLQTPTPRSQVAGIPGAPQQDPSQQIPTPDPNQPQPGAGPGGGGGPGEGGQPGPGQELPIDPIVATATQIAVDATATAVSAIATASQLAVDSAAATAIAEAEAQPPESPPTVPVDSPLPTPPLDPSLPPDGNQSGLPVAPGLETPTETPTPTETLPVETPLPGGDVTVLPPEITAVVGTETPAVVVLVVTSTPEGGNNGGLPEGQRPIVYPTETATPDFIMAAARTFDMAVTTFSWLWFLVGSLIFFVTTGIVAGLFFRQSEANRYDLPEPDYWLEEEPPPQSSRPSARTGTRPEDDWPAELP